MRKKIIFPCYVLEERGKKMIKQLNKQSEQKKERKREKWEKKISKGEGDEIFTWFPSKNQEPNKLKKIYYFPFLSV